jgi:hypothetical protein
LNVNWLMEEITPNTIPPFHTTKTANKLKTNVYGINEGMRCAMMFGALSMDRTRSTGGEEDYAVE